MKKLLVVGAFVVAICLSAFAGTYFSNQEHLELRAQGSRTLILFAVGNIEELKTGYDADTMEILISHIYTAHEYADDSDLADPLHQLWNALVFDGEAIAGKEDALIKALQDANPQMIDEIAMSMRTVS